MALLETNVGTGNQLLKPTDTSTLFRQRGTAKPVAATQPVIQQQSQVAAPPTPTATPLAKAEVPVKLASAKGVATQSAPMVEQATPLGEQYQYESPRGNTGILDKNYYEDLGFSTSKEKAEELRGTLGEIEKQIAVEQGNITEYNAELSKIQGNLEVESEKAWNTATTTRLVVHGAGSWDMPPGSGRSVVDSLSAKAGFIGTVHEVPAIKPGQSLSSYQLEHKDKWLGAGYQEWLGQWYTPAQIPRIVDPSGLQLAYTQEIAKQSYQLAPQGVRQYAEIIPYGDMTSWKVLAPIRDQVNTAVGSMKNNFSTEYAKQYDAQINPLLLKAAESQAALDKDVSAIDSQKKAVVDKQAADREGMAQTFNTLFRQRD